ncbi:DUF3289 family protein [Rouxiella sp. T17]|uniref:DUF3289 family protein n=1 Tax=Rouxiella sp. T17 TaxID=3085684 RepID=UPI002FC9D2F4
MVVGDGDLVGCRCDNNRVFATSDYFGESNVTKRAPSAEPVQRAQNAKKHSPLPKVTLPPQPLILPEEIYTTIQKMDDYAADDMLCGDLTEEQLKKVHHLYKISSQIDPFTGLLTKPLDEKEFYKSVDYPPNFVTLEESAKILFDEFRGLSDMFSFYGEYQDITRKIITHMQNNTGRVFKDPLLDKALKEQIINDKSIKSTLLKIIDILSEKTDFDNGYFPLVFDGEFEKLINSKSILPKFTSFKDYFNGLVISVHDTAATSITLTSLQVEEDNFQATIHYRIQDHFGLDLKDIEHWIYHEVPIFRIWFLLQRWEKFKFKPFITEMNATIDVTGKRNVP